MRSPRRVLYERLARRLSALDECVDMAARIRVYRRGPDGRAQPAELLPRVYGGRYNRLIRGYTDEEPAVVREISCHPGALDFLASEGPEIRVLALGSPGGGKSFAAERKGVLVGLTRPNSTIGIVAPTTERRQILWNDLLELLEPWGWVEAVRKSDNEIVLANRTKLQFVAAQQPSRRLGTPLQGYSWDAAIEDEHQNMTTKACQEVNFRGRRAGNAFRVFSTATNQFIPEFQDRLITWFEQPAVPGKARVVEFKGADNVFVDLDHWENQKPFLSKEDWDRLVDGKRTAMEGVIYRAFDPKESVRDLPAVAQDITAHLTRKVLGDPYEYVVGFDPGALVNVMHVLKAYRDPSEPNGVLWYVVDEVFSEQTLVTQHGLKLLSNPNYRAASGDRPANVVILKDPHEKNVKDTDNDRSDTTQLRNLGLPVYKAAAGPMSLKHRFAMVNALLEDAMGKRRLFLAKRDGRCVAPKAARSLRTYRYEDIGVKGVHDVSHYTDTIGYGLFRFEQFRGSDDFAARVSRQVKREFWEVG